MRFKETGGMAMAKRGRRDFCTACRKDTEYEVRKIAEKETIREKEYEFIFTAAICRECGGEMDLPGLMDLNIKERDRQYREAEGIISIEEIRKLMELYHIGKAPLSLALGFGEVTVARYLDGQVPSKGYSDIMRKALSDPGYMGALLEQNKDKIDGTAYQKAKKAAAELEILFDVPEKMLISIAYIFERMQEVTPLALQKLLYYIQGIYMVLFQEPLFEENCAAWQHGPVYTKVYALFRDFKYNPIEDGRFALLSGMPEKLSEDEKKTIDLVVKTFGKYSGKVLENITHNEKPWRDAREGYDSNERSNVIIRMGDMREYFMEVSERFDLGTAEGIEQYIASKLEQG